jgi:hypothetical protein
MAPPLKISLDTGTQFGQLVVLEEVRLPNTPGRIRHGFLAGPRGARCLCDPVLGGCGTETIVQAAALASGNTRSCGCLRIEVATARLPAMVAANTQHGLARTGSDKHPLYDSWYGMMSRCYNPGHEHYGRYGGRGITVCRRWHDPAAFISDIECLIGPRPPGMTLDRTDNDGNYEPGNIQWAEAQQRRQAGVILRVLAADYEVSIATMHRYVTGQRPRSQVAR